MDCQDWLFAPRPRFDHIITIGYNTATNLKMKLEDERISKLQSRINRIVDHTQSQVWVNFPEDLQVDPLTFKAKWKVGIPKVKRARIHPLMTEEKKKLAREEDIAFAMQIQEIPCFTDTETLDITIRPEELGSENEIFRLNIFLQAAYFLLIQPKSTYPSRYSPLDQSIISQLLSEYFGENTLPVSKTKIINYGFARILAIDEDKIAYPVCGLMPKGTALKNESHLNPDLMNESFGAFYALVTAVIDNHSGNMTATKQDFTKKTFNPEIRDFLQYFPEFFKRLTETVTLLDGDWEGLLRAMLSGSYTHVESWLEDRLGSHRQGNKMDYFDLLLMGMQIDKLRHSAFLTPDISEN